MIPALGWWTGPRSRTSHRLTRFRSTARGTELASPCGRSVLAHEGYTSSLDGFVTDRPLLPVCAHCEPGPRLPSPLVFPGT